MQEVVGGELQCVLRAGDVAERQVHGALHRALLAYGVERGTGRVTGGGERVGHELVALEEVADSSIVMPGEDRGRPPLLDHDVVHERADVPAGQGGRCGPAFVDGGEPGAEGGITAGVQVHGGHASTLA